MIERNRTIQLIWTHWRKNLGLDDEGLYDVIMLNFKPKRRMSEMTDSELEELLKIIKINRSPIRNGQVFEMTKKQWYGIHYRLRDLNWSKQALITWINKKNIVKSDDWNGTLETVSPVDARKIIAGLEGIRRWRKI